VVSKTKKLYLLPIERFGKVLRNNSGVKVLCFHRANKCKGCSSEDCTSSNYRTDVESVSSGGVKIRDHDI